MGRRIHTLDLLCVGGTSVVGIDLFCCRALVQTDKAVEEVVARRIVVVTARVVREIVSER